MGRNRDFHNNKSVLSNLMGMRLAMLEITRLGVAEGEDDEASVVGDDNGVEEVIM